MREYFAAKALEIDPREDRLPAWARDKLSTMRRAASEAAAELAALKTGTEPASFWLQSWDDEKRFYLPKNSGRVMFGQGETELQLSENFGGGGGYVGWLSVSGGPGGIVVAPHSSNVVLIRNVAD